MILQEIFNTDSTILQKKILCGEYNIPVKNIARYLGMSYPHTINVLNGVSRLTERNKSKLNSLIAQLESNA